MTIKELADELGLSKQAIRKQVSKLPPTDTLVGINRAILVKADGIRKIKAWVSTQVPTESINQVSTNIHLESIVELLKNELEVLREQLKEKDKQIGEMQKLLNQQQQLHLIEQQKLLLSEKTEPSEESQKKHWWSKK